MLMGECAKFAEAELAPLAKVGDVDGCKLSANGDVATPRGWCVEAARRPTSADCAATGKRRMRTMRRRAGKA